MTHHSSTRRQLTERVAHFKHEIQTNKHEYSFPRVPWWLKSRRDNLPDSCEWPSELDRRTYRFRHRIRCRGVRPAFLAIRSLVGSEPIQWGRWHCSRILSRGKENMCVFVDIDWRITVNEPTWCVSVADVVCEDLRDLKTLRIMRRMRSSDKSENSLIQAVSKAFTCSSCVEPNADRSWRRVWMKD